MHCFVFACSQQKGRVMYCFSIVMSSNVSGIFFFLSYSALVLHMMSRSETQILHFQHQQWCELSSFLDQVSQTGKTQHSLKFECRWISYRQYSVWNCRLAHICSTSHTKKLSHAHTSCHVMFSIVIPVLLTFKAEWEHFQK